MSDEQLDLKRAAPLPHTPGPWHAKRSTYGGWTILAETTRPADVGMFWMVGRTVTAEPEDEANVRLMVLAPEFLALGQRAVRLLEQREGEDALVDALLTSTRELIAKAEGR